MDTLSQKSDSLISWNSACLQHGPMNDRVYLMNPGHESGPDLLEWVQQIALQGDYSRVMVKIPQSRADCFLQAGFIQEAMIPQMFSEENGLFLALFRQEERQQDPRREEQMKSLQSVLHKAQQAREKHALPLGAQLFSLDLMHAADVATFLQQSFESYPFPVHDPAFIRSEMEAGTVYFAIEFQGNFIALASCEQKTDWGYAECTDFCTLPQWRGKHLASHLLVQMEDFLDFQKISCHMTIARASQPGMNLVFARAGWACAGTLTNSTQIGGQLESMNVWYRP